MYRYICFTWLYLLNPEPNSWSLITLAWPELLQLLHYLQIFLVAIHMSTSYYRSTHLFREVVPVVLRARENLGTTGTGTVQLFYPGSTGSTRSTR